MRTLPGGWGSALWLSRGSILLAVKTYRENMHDLCEVCRVVRA